MKIIPKFQQGGYAQYFTVYKPIDYNQQQRGGSQSRREPSASTKGELTQKDILEMLKDIDGLPNDMQAIVGNLMNTLQYSNLTGVSTQSLANMYLSNLYQVKVAAQNKNEYDKIMEEAQKDGTLQEPTFVGDNLLVLKEDGISQVSLSDYLANQGSYTPLTVSNLAHLRKYNPEFVNNQKILDVINNSMSFERIQKILDTAKISLGSTSYTEPIQADAAQGYRIFQNMDKSEQAKVLQEIADGTITRDSNYEQIKAYINYLCGVMPKRAKLWAAYKYETPDYEQATQQLVAQYLSGNLKYSTTIKVKTKTDVGTDDTSDPNNIKINAAQRFQIGTVQSTPLILNTGSTEGYLVNALKAPLVDSSENPLPINTTLEDITKSEFGPILDIQNATLGGNKIDPSVFKGIITRDQNIYSVDLPYYSKDGNIFPIIGNTEISKKIAEAKQELRSIRINPDDPESIKNNVDKINEVYKKHIVDDQYCPQYDINGNPTQWMRFAVLQVYADDNITGDLDDSLLSKVKDKNQIEQLKTIFKDDDFSQPWYWYNDEFYAGQLYMPMIVKPSIANTGSMKVGESNLLQALESTPRLNQTHNFSPKQ